MGLPPADIPLMALWDLIFSDRGSITNAKMSRDRGQPCLVTFEIIKFFENKPSEYTYADEAAMAETNSP